MQYGLLAMPLAFASMPLYIHAPDFYAAGLGAPLATIGTLLLGLRFVDAVQDPIIGRLSDRFAAYRKQMIAIAALLLVGSFYALFNPDEDHLLVWFALSMLLATTAFSIISINLNTLGGLWSTDMHEKTRITSMREAFGLIGLLCAVILPSWLMRSMPASAAFSWVSALLAMLACIAMVAFWKWSQRVTIKEPQKISQQVSLLRVIKTLPNDTRRFLMVYGISMLASSMPALLVLFFIRDRLHAESYTGLFLLLYFLAGIIGMPLWQRLSHAKGKANAWIASMLLAAGSLVWAFFLGSGDIWQFAAICLLSGIAFGADLALPPSILADQIQHHASEHNASIQFALLAFLAKASLALASFIGLSLLDIAEFKPAQENAAGALLMLSMLYAVLPGIIKLLSALLLYSSQTMFQHPDNQGGENEKTNHHINSRSGDYA